MVRRDPRAARALVVLLVIVGLGFAGADGFSRLARAFSPPLQGEIVPTVATQFDLWISPPSYTGLAPLLLTAERSDPVRVPTGSELVAQVHHAAQQPTLWLDGAATNLTSLLPASVGNIGGSQAHLNMQPFLTLSFCIALQGIFPSQT